MCDGQNSIHVVRSWHRFTRPPIATHSPSTLFTNYTESLLEEEDPDEESDSYSPCDGISREIQTFTWSPRLTSTASARHQPDSLQVIWPWRLPLACVGLSWLVLPVLPCFRRLFFFTPPPLQPNTTPKWIGNFSLTGRHVNKSLSTLRMPVSVSLERGIALEATDVCK